MIIDILKTIAVKETEKLCEEHDIQQTLDNLASFIENPGEFYERLEDDD